jgi:hypothetical protein
MRTRGAIHIKISKCVYYLVGGYSCAKDGLWLNVAVAVALVVAPGFGSHSLKTKEPRAGDRSSVCEA